MERWSSGLRHTLGKRARLTASAGSNPVLSATDAIYCGFEIFQTQHIVSFFFSTQFFDPFLGQNWVKIAYDIYFFTSAAVNFSWIVALTNFFALTIFEMLIFRDVVGCRVDEINFICSIREDIAVSFNTKATKNFNIQGAK